MSAPTVSDLQTLRFAQGGSPVATLAPSNAGTSTLAFAWRGSPVVASYSATPALAVRPVVFVAM